MTGSSGSTLADRAWALRVQIADAVTRGLTPREEVELTALAFSLKYLLDDLDPAPEDDPAVRL